MAAPPIKPSREEGMTDKTERVILTTLEYIEITLVALGCLLLMVFLVGVTILLVRNAHAEPVVSNQKPPVVCGQIGPMTVWC
jgi:hypothetical protein